MNALLLNQSIYVHQSIFDVLDRCFSLDLSTCLIDRFACGAVQPYITALFPHKSIPMSIASNASTWSNTSSASCSSSVITVVGFNPKFHSDYQPSDKCTMSETKCVYDHGVKQKPVRKLSFNPLTWEQKKQVENRLNWENRKRECK